MVSKVFKGVNVLGSELALGTMFTVYSVKAKIQRQKSRAAEWGAWGLWEASHLLCLPASVRALSGKEWKGTLGVPSGKKKYTKITL